MFSLDFENTNNKIDDDGTAYVTCITIAKTFLSCFSRDVDELIIGFQCHLSRTVGIVYMDSHEGLTLWRNT